MGTKLATIGITAALAALLGYSIVSSAHNKKENIRNIQVGPSQFFLSTIRLVLAESFFSLVKNELVHHRSFNSRDEARTAIFEYIEMFYNG